MRVDLVLLAKSAAFNIAADIGSEAGPPEFSGDQLASFQEAGMTGGFVIVATLEDGTAEGVVCRDVDATFVSKDAGFDLPVSESGAEGERDVLVHRLESLEDEGVTCRGRLDAVGEGGVDKVDKEGRWEKGDVAVVGVICREEVGSTGEGVGASKEFSGDMDHLQVEIREVNKPACLSAVKRLGLTEVGKIFVVGEDLYRERGTMEVVSPRLQGANNGEKFAIIDIVVLFGGGERLRQVGTWMPVAVGVGLEEDGARRMFRGVCGDGEGGGEVREVKDGFREEEAFEGVEGGLAGRGPIPREVFLGEVEEGTSDVGVVGNEPTVEVGESKERAHVFHLGWRRPVCDAVELDRVHG